MKARSPEEIAREIAGAAEGREARASSRALVTHRKGELRELFDELKARGFLRVEVGGEARALARRSARRSQKHVKHTIDLVVDRVVIGSVAAARLTEAVEIALREGKGELVAAVDASGKESASPSARTAPAAARAIPSSVPQSFSFNSPLGMCPACNGLGTRAEVDPELVIPDPTLSIRDGRDRAVGDRRWRAATAGCSASPRPRRRRARSSLDTPWKDIPKEKQKKLLFGLEGEKLNVALGQARATKSHGTFGVRFEGVIPNLERRYRDTTSEPMREHYRKFFRDRAVRGVRRAAPPRREPRGRRRRQEHRRAHGDDRRGGARRTSRALSLSAGADARSPRARSSRSTAASASCSTSGSSTSRSIAPGPSLSGGEAQRIRLASQLGSELSGVMYVLDEPSIGLHPRDNERLIATLRHLRDLGNTVLVVEHDEETIRAADHVVDFGPGAGHLGGKVVAEGTPDGDRARTRRASPAPTSPGAARSRCPTTRRAPKGAIAGPRRARAQPARTSTSRSRSASSRASPA